MGQSVVNVDETGSLVVPEFAPDEIILSQEEIDLILATARYNKIKKMQWLNGRNWDSPDIEERCQLTDEEKNAAIKQANSNKKTSIYFKTIQDNKRRLERLAKESELAKWNYAHFFREMRDRHYRLTGGKFVYNEMNEKLIKAICFRLSGDQRYVTELGFSFERGLIIRGTPGLGKSHVVNLVKDNPVCPVQVVTMNEITKQVIERGDFYGAKFSSYSIVYIDDVGTEYFGDNAIKRYGTEINWFKNLIEETYAKDKRSFSKVMFSTNDSFAVLEEKYGFRVRDRLAECFDVVTIEGESMRRK